MGLGRVKPGVDLHCRKVLIMKGPEELLPEWMRFVRGVIDSDDLTLNISRETLQDNRVVRKLSQVITGRFLKFLAEKAEKEPGQYAEFYKAFHVFLKEGATQDFAHRDELARLLRFETSSLEPGQVCSLADYVSRMRSEQKDIYHISGPSREAIEAGPYLEAFKARGLEVLYTFEQIDDYVLSNLMQFEEKRFVSADQQDLELPGEAAVPQGEPLAEDEMASLCEWMKEVLGERVSEVKASGRLVDSPAAATTMAGMSGSMQRLMMAMNREAAPSSGLVALELNPRSALVQRVNALRTENADFARDLAEQLLDNALLAAGLLMDPRRMVERMTRLLGKAAGV
jgi:molecular chaperone HtpG